MQVGMLLGRAAMGGGLLAIIDLIGHAGAVALLLVTNRGFNGPAVCHSPSANRKRVDARVPNSAFAKRYVTSA